MAWLLNAGLVLGTFLFMEFMAWFTHKYVMHGFMWCWHKSHHEPREGHFEKNDLFAVVFSIPSIVMIVLGLNLWEPLLWIGIGVACYGLFYLIFHDGIVHQRFPFNLITFRRGSYMRRIIDGHHIHHAVHEKDGAVSFGFLYAPTQDHLGRELKRKQAQRTKPLSPQDLPPDAGASTTPRAKPSGRYSEKES